MNILISTEPDDIHAVMVKLALEDQGHQCILLFTADMPTQQTNSIYFDNTHYQWLSEDNAASLPKVMTAAFDTVWWRRPRRPFISEKVHRNDLEFVRRENSLFHDSIPFLITQKAWWVNPQHAIKQANSKSYQLKLARESGFKIPATLISNSADKIREFILTHQERGVIYKAFSSHYWYENDQLKMSYTKPVALTSLPSDFILQMSPGIFQQQIKKSYELRVTCFGDHLVAVKIFSQMHVKGINDWRHIPGEDMKLALYQLPQWLSQMITGYMKKLGIVFGCFDFIVTPDNEYYFLEVNQQGQFLWIEYLLPELKLLDKFVYFLLNKSVNYESAAANISLKDYEESCYQLMEENKQHHVYLNALKRQSS